MAAYAEVILEKPLLETLKTGTSATFIVFQTPEDAFMADQANEWNKKYRRIKAYSGDGSNFKMDVSFIGGITKANLEEQFSTWDSLTSDIKVFVNQK